ALRFGGEPSLISPELAPLYLALGDYHALATLPSWPLSPGEKERARWLEAHPTRLIAPDSVIVASYRASVAGAPLGHLPIRVNGRTLDAVIDAGTRGVVISDSVATAARPRRFVAKAGQAVPGAAAVVD